jgi:hypothetical protein
MVKPANFCRFGVLVQKMAQNRFRKSSPTCKWFAGQPASTLGDTHMFSSVGQTERNMGAPATLSTLEVWPEYRRSSPEFREL